MVVGVALGFFASRELGATDLRTAFAALVIVLAAAAGNLMNTLFLEPLHRSIGASTAVFAALGLVAGYVWFGKLMSQDRWSERFGPIIGGLALLMYTGTGGENTDIGAHFFGFVGGFGAGLVLIRKNFVTNNSKTQRVCGALALGLVVMSWSVALLV